MVQLTKMQQRIYDYIAQTIRTQGYPPSVREIGDAVGLKSPSTVHFHLKHMEELGVIGKGAGKGRALTLTEPLPEENQIPIVGALVGIVRAIRWAAKNLQGAAVDPDTPISVDWDDSYITDAETRMSQMRDDALSGLLPRYKYLSARYGVSEEDARKLAQEAADENKQPELSFGGGG